MARAERQTWRMSIAGRQRYVASSIQLAAMRVPVREPGLWRSIHAWSHLWVWCGRCSSLSTRDSGASALSTRCHATRRRMFRVGQLMHAVRFTAGPGTLESRRNFAGSTICLVHPTGIAVEGLGVAIKTGPVRIYQQSGAAILGSGQAGGGGAAAQGGARGEACDAGRPPP